MDDLAAKLKLNKATIYHHFPGGKQELLFQIISTALDSVSEELDRVEASAPPEERIRGYFDAMVRFQDAHLQESVVYFQQRPWLKQTLTRSQFRAVSDH